jgi:hypothetical protein
VEYWHFWVLLQNHIVFCDLATSELIGCSINIVGKKNPQRNMSPTPITVFEMIEINTQFALESMLKTSLSLIAPLTQYWTIPTSCIEEKYSPPT